MTREELQARAERLRDLLGEGERTGDFSRVVDEMYAPEAVYLTEYAGAMVVRAEGVAEIRATHYDRDMSLGWQGWSFPYQGIFIGDDNRVIAHWTNRGPGRRPDGSFYETPGFSLLRFGEDGRITSQQDVFDLAHQMHLCDELEEAGLLDPALKENWVIPMKAKLIEMLTPG